MRSLPLIILLVRCISNCVVDVSMPQAFARSFITNQQRMDSASKPLHSSEESDRRRLHIPLSRLQLRGGQESEKASKIPIYERLREAEELHKRGALSAEEYSLERGRLVVELAMGNLHDGDDFGSDSSDEDEDPELYMNYTLARLASTLTARTQAWGQRGTVDALARGRRWHKAVGFSDEEYQAMARSELRVKREEEIGLEVCDIGLVDRRRLWAAAARALFDNMTATDTTPQPLSNLSFFAKRDLAVGETISVALLNFTGPREPTPFRVDCSPVGKISDGVWMHRCRVLNLTVASSIFQDEPIMVFLPPSCNITVDTRRVAMEPGAFLERLFNTTGQLPRLPQELLGGPDPDPLPPLARGKVLRIAGLDGATRYNGLHCSVLGIASSRYQVQVIETGKKLLVAPKNLEDIEGGSNSSRRRDEAARDAWALVEALHRGEAAGDGDGEGRGANSTEEADGRGPAGLLESEVRELAALNISLSDEATSPFRAISHCDGGFGRHIIRLDGKEMVADEEEELRKTSAGRSPKEVILDVHLQRAAHDGDADRVGALIAAGASTATRRFPGSPHGELRRTPLHVAAWEGHAAAVEVLLQSGADVHALDANNATALHFAAVKGEHDIAHLLLDAGGDPAARNAFNRSCVHRAVFYGHAAVAQTLLAAAGPHYDLAEIVELTDLSAVPLSRLPEFRALD